MTPLPPQPPVELLRRIDAACDRFEEAWRGGAMPRVEDYLPLFNPDERPALLTALQSLQFELAICQTDDSPAGPMSMTQPMPAFNDVDAPEATFEEVPEEGDLVQDDSLPHVTFRVIAGPHAGAGYRFLEHNTLFAGRLSKAQLRLEKDLHFSRHHFRLEVNPPTCFLMDLNSRNGTYVNGERVRERFLQDGDIVSGGRTRMIVTIFDPKLCKVKTAEQTIAEAPAQFVPISANEVVRNSTTSQNRQSPVQTSEPPRGIPERIERPANSVRSEQKSDAAINIPGYRIVDKIGEGDLGTVYRAQKLATHERCALKVLIPNDQTDEKSIQTFLREASVLNQLNHPHIIRLIEMGAFGRSVFLATEYVKSIDWNHLVSRYSSEKRIRTACGLMSQVLSALEYAHTRSLVHRDVKPSNVLITKHEDKLSAKLADFGLAKQYTTAGMSQVTRDGDVLGSLPFMSPDQFLNSRDARPTCDIYSAGATLYWMLTGHEPIPLDGHPCKFLAILESPPTPIQQYNSAIPAPIAAVVHRALEKSPEKRFTSAAEMRHVLRTAMT